MVLVELQRLLGKRHGPVLGRRIPLASDLRTFCRDLPEAKAFAVDGCGSFPHNHAVVRGVLERRPEAGVLVVSEAFTEAHAIAFLRMGVKGLLPYAEVPRMFREAMVQVAHGRLWVSRELVCAFVASEIRPARHRLSLEGQDLSRREQEVLKALLDNRSNKEIGAELHISERTAKFHVANLMRKAGVRRRSDLIAQWWQSGAALAVS